MVKKLGLLTLLGIVTLGLMPATASAGAIIGNGTITMGVNDYGHLNTPFGPDPLGIGFMGLRFAGLASTEPGCQCEGWGVAVTGTGDSGYANWSVDSGAGGINLTLLGFASTATTATSKVALTSNPNLVVTQDYHPILATPNLYEDTVTISNFGATDLSDVIYRRVMDWDIYPTPFSEMVTIDRGGLPVAPVEVAGVLISPGLRTDNNGFNSGNPFSFSSFGLLNADFTDAGPDDHGALFDFNFGTLKAGHARTFSIFYGAAASEAGADAARLAVGASVYSYGQNNFDFGAAGGAPGTFIFAFKGVGGVGDPLPPPTPASVPEPASMLLLGSGLLALARRLRKS